MSETITNNWQKSRDFSMWLSNNLQHRPQLTEFLVEFENTSVGQLDLEERFAYHLANNLAEDALRLLRIEHFSLCMIRDLEHNAPLEEIMLAMSKLGDFAITAAHSIAREEMIERFGTPRMADGKELLLHVIGMGKLGGYELNVSSDIDLIFLYADDDAQTDGNKSLSASEYFIRLGRKIIALLDEPNGLGRVFRVDMRLRPHGDSGPLACSFEFFENYLIRDGRDWERYAWIKGRLIIGNRWQELQELIRPFVFRKYLDFSAVTAMHDLHRQICEQVESKDMQGNIKLGRGGIREIEFIAQVLQLMRGGRRVELQIQPTIKVLNALAEAGFMQTAKVEKLKNAYDFLRKLEHRLQYREDQQTQTLPTDRETLISVISVMDIGVDEFYCYFANIQQEVAKQFSDLFPKNDDDKNSDNINQKLINASEKAWRSAKKLAGKKTNFEVLSDEDKKTEYNKLLEQLYVLAIDSNLNEVADKLINHARNSRIRYLSRGEKSESGREHNHLIFTLLQKCSGELNKQTDNKSPKKLQAAQLIPRFLDILIVLARRPSYLQLLSQTPNSLNRLFRFLQTSSWGAQYLEQHPILLDDLLDPRLLEQKFNRAEFTNQINSSLRDGMDSGEKMNCLRELHQAVIFQLLVNDLENKINMEEVADNLSDAADVIVTIVLQQCWQQQIEKYPDIDLDNPKLAVIAYGKLGGKELGYVSDLDLVVVYEDDNLDNIIYYNKTAISLTHWLNSNTEAGVLFETDYRLRPDGDAGVLVPSLAGLADYQKNKAWVWEHQAITRARFCAGSPQIGEKFENLRKEIIETEREKEKLKAEIVNMREKMHSAHKNKSEMFDIKHDSGGLVDIEFIVQFNVLLHSHTYPKLSQNKGNIALLLMLAKYNIINQELAKTCSDAYREYRRAQHQCRLNGYRYARISKDNLADYQAAVCRLWQESLVNA